MDKLDQVCKAGYEEFCRTLNAGKPNPTIYMTWENQPENYKRAWRRCAKLFVANSQIVANAKEEKQTTDAEAVGRAVGFV